ncbi:MAG: hypothetical protein E6H07_20040 [Bacteroidetes bacterium]|nr:MAG: hypothetical protein E6H07_20040 [Bacteroidota bacterium]
MNLYNNIFICYYNLFVKANDFNPRLGALMLIMVLEFFHLVIVFRLIQPLIKIRDEQLPPGFFIVVFFFVCLFFLVRYYTKDRIATLQEKFAKKNDNTKSKWVSFSIIAFIASFFLLIIVLKK